MNNQDGQVVLILVLVMTVALAIGISVIQRSLSDVSTATKVEQSSRAFSAAEAGIEKALKGDLSGVIFTENSSSATATGNILIPAVPTNGTRQDPLEYPPLAKEETAHVWLADFTSVNNPPALFYKQTSLDIYWADPNASSDKAALELTLVYYDSTSSQYKARKWYLDQITRTPPNNFTTPPAVSCTGFTLTDNSYQCKYTIGGASDSQGPLPANLMLIRARLLYEATSQPFAVQAVSTCGTDCSIPPQAKKLISTGISGQTQRKVQLFQLLKVVPPYFDYAIFSAAEINK